MDNKLKLKIFDKDGRTLAVSEASERVSLVYCAEYKEGDRVVLQTEREGMTCRVQLEDTMAPALVYVPGRAAEFHIPFGGDRLVYSPKSFTGSRHVLRARAANEDEVKARRNLALNPYDRHGDNGFFPHAEANVETRNESVFAARNAIDGVYENSSHGEWPYQSWGINRDPKAALTVRFGRPVAVDEVRLTLRADYPHDSHWTSATVTFSDGTRETFALTDDARPQSFKIAPRTVEWLTLSELIKADDASPFPALTQIEAWGCDA